MGGAGPASERQHVAGAFEGFGSLERCHPVVVRREPGDVVGRLALALGMAEEARDEDVAVYDTGIGGEDEVGETGRRFQELERGPGRPERLHQAVELGGGGGRVGVHLHVHEGIDLVGHGEVIGPAQEVPAPPAERRHRPGSDSTPHNRSDRSPTKRPTSVTIPSAWWLPRSASLVTTA